MAAAQPTNRRGGEPGGRGRQRSRANPFKSTQLRQWGFICYLGGHIVSRRERTDRLRRASDGLARREPVPSRSVARRGDDFYRALSPLYFTTVSTSRTSYQSRRATLPSARKADSPLHVSSTEISLPLPPFPLCPFLGEDTFPRGDGTNIEA